MDGAWVGTWRPHRPRGPIMAHFTSPGPKYSIPRTTGKTPIARGVSFDRLFFLGYLAHDPTKTKGPTCVFPRAKPPVADSCSPGPRYYVLPSITRNGKSVAPAQHICGLPKIKTEITPGPSEYHFSSPSSRQDKHALLLPWASEEEPSFTASLRFSSALGNYATDKANKHLYKRAPAQSMAFWHKAVRTDQPPGEPWQAASLPPRRCSSPRRTPTRSLPIPLPGPGTYTLPRLVGPNTAYTHASPCYSMTGKRKHNGFAEDLAKTPGPAAFPKVELDIYKKRAPMYTMGTKSSLGGNKTVKPGPADYSLGKVTLIKPQAPAPTFGLRHSLYTASLISPI
ncbi:ciliary microtubule associated protein 1A-like [Phoenicopterus ruber ruber]